MAMLVAGMVLLVGCGGSVDGAETAAPETVRWDPCSITPDALKATGLDPNYRELGWGEGIVVEDWARCSFSPVGFDVPYLLSVKSSTTRTMEEARTNSLNIDGHDLEVAQRTAFQYETSVASSLRDCNIAIDVPPGLVVFTVNYMRNDDGVDPCDIVAAHVYDLETALPSRTK